MNKQQTFRLVVGASSGEGHKQHDDFLVLSNAESVDRLRSAYDKGVKITGVDVEKLCKNYQEFSVCVDDIAQIERMATNRELSLAQDEDFVEQHYRDPGQDGEEDDGFYWNERRMLNPSLDFVGKYFVLWRATALIGDPDISIEVLSPDSMAIGGYCVYD